MKPIKPILALLLACLGALIAPACLPGRAGAQAIKLPDSPKEIRGSLTMRLSPAGSVVNGTRNGKPSGLSDGTHASATYRVRMPTTYAGSVHYFVYMNSYFPSGSAEIAGTNAIDVRASMEDPTTISGVAGGTGCIDIFFGSLRTVTIDPKGIALGGPVFADIPANWAVMVRTFVDVTNHGGVGAMWPLNGHLITAGQGAISSSGGGNSDGWTNDSDLTDSGTVGVVSGNPYGPSAMLTVTANGAEQSVLGSGDSIYDGTGCVSGKGWVRIGLDAVGASMLKISQPGERATTFAKMTSRQMRMVMARFGCNSVCIGYGTNDTPDAVGHTAAQIEADIGTIATAYRRAGFTNIVISTILPKTTSTDGWRTATNQSIAEATAEAKRGQINNYLLAPASAGPSNSVLADYPFVKKVIDPCAFVEVDATNTLTHNGGRWKAPTADLFTQAAGAGLSNSGAVITDTRQNWTVNAYTGKVFYVTSGTNAGGIAYVTKNSATTLNLLSTVAVDATSAYVIADSPSIDGTHPSESAATAASACITGSTFNVVYNVGPPYKPVVAADIAPGILDYILNPLAACTR